MRIAMIDPSLFTLPYDLKLIAGLEGQGHEVMFYGKPIPEEETVAAGTGIAVRPHFYRAMSTWGFDRLPKSLSKAVKGLCHLGAMQRLVQALRLEKPDIIHFQWLPLPVVDRRFLNALREIAPLIVTAHDSAPFNDSPGAAIQQMGARAVFGRFDRVIVHTEQSRRRLAGYGVALRNIARIDHGFLNDDQPVAPPKEIRPGAPVRFVLFGKLKPYKGADILIEAAKRLPADVAASCEVLIVGKPYIDTASLVQAAAGAVADITFDFRFVPENEMAGVLLAADVLVFPYREIEVSGVLMAALRLSRPMLASDIGGFAELLSDGKNALLVPAGDVDALAEAMARLIRDQALRARLAGGMTETVASIPSWDEIGRLTTEVYAEALRDRAASAMAAAAE
jgi:glycosyltransferase involved in cell wall biosynthesis